ncbi:hypothetical protein CC79DRAFT_1337892 [Sarocladium strictum]
MSTEWVPPYPSRVWLRHWLHSHKSLPDGDPESRAYIHFESRVYKWQSSPGASFIQTDFVRTIESILFEDLSPLSRKLSGIQNDGRTGLLLIVRGCTAFRLLELDEVLRQPEADGVTAIPSAIYRALLSALVPRISPLLPFFQYLDDQACFPMTYLTYSNIEEHPSIEVKSAALHLRIINGITSIVAFCEHDEPFIDSSSSSPNSTTMLLEELVLSAVDSWYLGVSLVLNNGIRQPYDVAIQDLLANMQRGLQANAYVLEAFCYNDAERPNKGVSETLPIIAGQRFRDALRHQQALLQAVEDCIQTMHASRSTTMVTLSSNQLKLSFLSQNLMSSTVILLFVLLPPIFVSTFFSTDVVTYQGAEDSTHFSSVALSRWLQVALPLTFLTLGCLYCVFWFASTGSTHLRERTKEFQHELLHGKAKSDDQINQMAPREGDV